MANVQWIKIAVDMFDNRKIKQIESMPEGDALVVIWVKLLCLAGNVNDYGHIYFTREVPYTEQMLATEFGRPLVTIQLALRTFERFGMIEIIDDILHISNWERYQNIEGMEKIKEQNRKRQKKFYDKKHGKLPNVRPNVSITEPNATDIEEEKEEEKEEEIELEVDVEVEAATTNIFTVYESTGRMLNSIESEKLIELEKDFGMDWVCRAIERAAERGHVNVGYITGILRSWRQNGGIDSSSRKSAVEATQQATRDMLVEWAMDMEEANGRR